MKRTAVLSLAACAGANALRGGGVEEVGEQIEHFPPPEYRMEIDRRLIEVQEEGDEIVVATQIMEEYYDEFPEVDVVGNVLKGDDLYYHEGWVDSEREHKEYARDPDSEVLVDTDLMGDPMYDHGAVDQYDRRTEACSQGQQEYKIICKTDNYAYEFRWTLAKFQSGSYSEKVASGPRSGTNYADDQVYAGRWCLPQGKYQFQMTDSAGDGMCSGGGFGCGWCRTWLDGKDAGSAQGQGDKWSRKNLPFEVNPFTSRIDGTGTSNLGEWCKKVRSVTQSPKRGTCTLPNGQRGYRVRVLTKVDKYGMETSWQVTKNGATKMKMGPIIPSNGQEVIESCLPAGKYTFTVNDMDGICCRHGEGGYTLSVDGLQLFNGGSFVKTQSYDFQLGFDWVSTMNERDCEWWWAHDYRRRDWHTRCYKGFYCNKEYRVLKWSPKLAADALDYANRLLPTCDDPSIKHDQTDQGENLAKNKGKGDWGRLYAAELVTRRFVDNEEFWGWNKNAHLTQAMWYDSHYIGCGDSLKRFSDGRLCRMQVCRYAKAGNCMMAAYNSHEGNNWMKPMMMDESPCGPMCPPDDGCYH